MPNLAVLIASATAGAFFAPAACPKDSYNLIIDCSIDIR
jgi:hypothetical protein